MGKIYTGQSRAHRASEVRLGTVHYRAKLSTSNCSQNSIFILQQSLLEFIYAMTLIHDPERRS